MRGEIVENCSSTQDLLRVRADEGAPEGFWIRAKSQDMGRGRAGHSWLSPEGGLYLSFLLKPKTPEAVSWVPLAAGVALARAFGLRILWPNDLMDDAGKVGGILCEGVSGARGMSIMVGVGINCGSAPEVIERKSSFIAMEAGKASDLVVSALTNALIPWSAERIPGIRDGFWEFSANPKGTFATRGGESGIFSDLGPNGEMMLKLSTGELRTFLTP